MAKWLTLLPFFFLFISGLRGQQVPQRFFEDITLRIDTALYSLGEDQLMVQGEPHLYFQYQEENPVVEIRLYPAYRDIDRIALVNEEGFDIIDSLININEEYYRMKLRLRDITQSDFLMLAFRLKRKGPEHRIYELRLFPSTKTIVFLPEEPDELFIGEEKVIRLETNHPGNIRLPKVWTTGLPINYRFSRKDDHIFIHLLPNQLGEQRVHTFLDTRKPFINENKQVAYKAGPIEKVFTVKPAKLAFLNINKREVSLSENARREGIEIELSYNDKLQMQKTYRVEAQEEAGGPLVAEIFTRNVLANGRVLCWLRLYNYHRRQDGYLYIKDGDVAQFITNLNIVEETDIQSISLRREGKDWEKGTAVYPGETVDIKLEGLSLHRADFRFDGLVEVRRDSVISNDREVAFTGRVPINIVQRQAHIYDGTERTGHALRVREYERSRPFDFIIIDYGEDSVRADEANLLLFVEDNLNELTLRFDNNLIDEGRLHGPQEIEMNVQVLDKNNSILDQRDIRNITVCPGPASPRSRAYSQEGCQRTNIKINEYLRKKTFELDIWTTIRLKISHKPEKYGKEGLSKTIEFVLYRSSTFDIDVSFPAGLVVKRLQEPGFGNLGGISMAMMAQFSFYKDKKVAKAKPYKFGAGFLAFNAFNFSENNSGRDIGVVVLASLYPLPSKDRSRLSFPLYAGGGYFLSESKWFMLFGPGIRVRL